jgi:hypothetical protein
MSIRTAISSFLSPARASTPMARTDADDIARAVARYARLIGCNESNVTSAVSTSLRSTRDTLGAVREGKQRANQLLYRQNHNPFAPVGRA